MHMQQPWWQAARTKAAFTLGRFRRNLALCFRKIWPSRHRVSTELPTSVPRAGPEFRNPHSVSNGGKFCQEFHCACGLKEMLRSRVFRASKFAFVDTLVAIMSDVKIFLFFLFLTLLARPRPAGTAPPGCGTLGSSSAALVVAHLPISVMLTLLSPC